MKGQNMFYTDISNVQIQMDQEWSVLWAKVIMPKRMSKKNLSKFDHSVETSFYWTDNSPAMSNAIITLNGG
jgi:hypothetical protein